MLFSPARALRFCGLVLASSIVLYGGASCDSDGGTSSSGEGGHESDAVVYEGGTTDEALEQLVAAEPTDVPAKAAEFDDPSAGAELVASEVPTFEWHTGWTARRAPSSRSRHAGAFDLFGPIREAHAHGAPFNGTGYYLTFKQGNETLLEVFTSKQSYTPDAASWDKLQTAEGEITANVLTGIFDNNDLGPDGGPFIGWSVTFTIVR